ncbi:MAG TPA: single-stranded DNA-binding protein, partial [Nitratidesulfovibrio sp.]|nr:single-stranded DNA-binding protein [Nitratidesulfovibrio sp.]HEU6435903.1 single-stranded DNA-binding protein [Nitratidesulfovibrio sp.]
MLNKVMIIGRLGRDPELRYAQNGTPIANLRIAT